jgi:hypothetical protein
MPASPLPVPPWWLHFGRELPECLPGDWRPEPIAAGYRLRHADGLSRPPVPPDQLVAESDRMALVVDGDRLDERAAVGISALLKYLPPASPRAVRLVLPMVDMRIARRMADHEGIDLISADGLLTAHGGIISVSAPDESPPYDTSAIWQWHRFQAGQPPQQLGASHPRVDPATEDPADPYSQYPSPAVLWSLTTLIPGYR